MTDERKIGMEVPPAVGVSAAPDGAVATTSAKPRRKSLIREYGEAIAIAILLALVIRTLVVQAFTIPSGSMMDTLLVGDYILVNKFLYGPELPIADARVPGLRDPARGDIIVFKYPQDEKRDFIKRIVAVPGETVQIRGQQVFVNGRVLREPYVKKADSPLPAGGQAYCGYAYGCEPTVVPANSYFVMGDNRDNSQDSRYWGFVKRDKIKGKAFLIYWSWDSDRHWLRWWRLANYIPIAGDGRVGSGSEGAGGPSDPRPSATSRPLAAISIDGHSPGSALRGTGHPGPPAPSEPLPTRPGPLGVLSETAPNQMSLGLYIHVPFCTKKCYFCSFNTAPMGDEAMRVYLDALHREIEIVASAPWAARVRLETVFFGGGTPSLLGGDALTAILDQLRERFAVARDAEITVESNPESLDGAKLAQYRAAGVSRISLGVQAMDDTILPAIGRLHDARAARVAFEACRAAGFDDVSVDLMYGLPGLDLDGWTRGIRAVLDWGPDHLSAYGLTLDPGSLWGASGVSGLPPEETVVAQYWALAHEAKEHGFEHYEVSNYARAGHRSRHNQVYWRRGEYLALGPGACGFVGDVRYANAKAVTRYAAMLDDGALPLDGSERLTADQALAERLFLGLRTADGVPHAALDARVAAMPSLRCHVDGWLADGLMELDGDRVRLTERGFLLSDALFVELI